MKEGDVILVSLPQADQQAKKRPAVVLREMPLYRDLLVCGISSQLQPRVVGFDEVIGPGDADFPQSGLLAPSLVRLGFLAVVARKGIVGVIGTIASERHRRLMQNLSAYLAPTRSL